MTTKINMKCDKEIHDETDKRKRLCQQEIARFQQKILVWSAILFSLGFFLLFWNIYLNQQIKSLHSDIDVLLTSCQKRNLISDQEDFSDYFDSLGEDDYNSEDSSNTIRRISDDRVAMNVNESENLNVDHQRVKRSKGSKKSHKKGIKRKIFKLLRQNKGIGIHVEAKDPNPNPEFQKFMIPGKTITNWKMPKEKTLFDLSQLKSNGFITVPVDGLYFLYSQVIFIDSPGPSMAAEIGVGPYGSTTFTKCLLARHENPARSDQSYAACHSNGIKHLTKGDKISLMVQPPTISVYLSHQFTYFGAFLLGF